VSAHLAYCPKCKAKREFDGEISVSASGIRVANGKCPTCGTTLHRILGRLAPQTPHNHLTRDVKPIGQCDGCDTQPRLRAEVNRLRTALSGQHLMMLGAQAFGTAYDCHRCYSEAGTYCHYMLLCKECGNKRCPKASDHRLDCTGSNESGQPGSVY
jgi:hypothetical protein